MTRRSFFASLAALVCVGGFRKPTVKCGVIYLKTFDETHEWYALPKEFAAVLHGKHVVITHKIQAPLFATVNR